MIEAKVDTIINTDMIIRIMPEWHNDRCYMWFPGSVLIEVDVENAQKIFDEIGLDL